MNAIKVPMLRDKKIALDEYRSCLIEWGTPHDTGVGERAQHPDPPRR